MALVILKDVKTKKRLVYIFTNDEKALAYASRDRIFYETERIYYDVNDVRFDDVK